MKLVSGQFPKFKRKKPVFAVLPKTQQILLVVHRVLIEDCCFKVVLIEVIHYFVQVIILQKAASEHVDQILDILIGKVLQSAIET